MPCLSLVGALSAASVDLLVFHSLRGFIVDYLKTGSTGLENKDAAIDIGMKEQWVRGFETYAMEGKAPSIDLRSAFEHIRQCIFHIGS